LLIAASTAGGTVAASVVAVPGGTENFAVGCVEGEPDVFCGGVYDQERAVAAAVVGLAELGDQVVRDFRDRRGDGLGI